MLMEWHKNFSYFDRRLIFPAGHNHYLRCKTRTKTSIRYAKENDRKKRERRKERERKVEGDI